jgi:hypothetical protein
MQGHQDSVRMQTAAAAAAAACLTAPSATASYGAAAAAAAAEVTVVSLTRQLLCGCTAAFTPHTMQQQPSIAATTCLSAMLNLAGQGFNSTDQVYYITALNSGSCSDNIIAYTIICHMEPFTYRPNVAAINLCPKFWALSEPAANKQVSALVHEMIHGLVSVVGAAAVEVLAGLIGSNLQLRLLD